MINGGFTANDINTFTDLGLHLYCRPETPPPMPKIIEEEVPYMHGTYDFSAINGEVAYERRELRYTFGFLGTLQEIDEKVTELLEFARGIWNVDLYDDNMPDRYFTQVRFAGAEYEYEDPDGHDAVIVLNFTAHPFRTVKGTSKEVL